MLVRPHKKKAQFTGCLLCGAELSYTVQPQRRDCSVCGKQHDANAECKAGHYVCDNCHAAGTPDRLALLRNSGEKDAWWLFEQIAARTGVHMHGPEHHVLVPCVLLTAFRNNGGELDLGEALGLAVKRAGTVPGGACGFFGACGAAVGAGIFAAVLTGATPMSTDDWGAAQAVTAHALTEIAKTGGPRCCKRTARTAILAAAQFAEARFGVAIPVDDAPCVHSAANKDCLRVRCGYYGRGVE